MTLRWTLTTALAVLLLPAEPLAAQSSSPNGSPASSRNASQASSQNSEPQFRRDLLVGSWKVNWEKSTGVNAAPGAQRPAMYRQYQDHGDGFMLHTVLAAPPGRNPQLQLLGAIKYDNKEYPTYDASRLTDLLESGKIPAQTVTFKVVDAYRMEWADKTSGRVTASGTMTISEDGRTMTLTSTSPGGDGRPGSTSALVYEKQ